MCPFDSIELLSLNPFDADDDGSLEVNSNGRIPNAEVKLA